MGVGEDNDVLYVEGAVEGVQICMILRMLPTALGPNRTSLLFNGDIDGTYLEVMNGCQRVVSLVHWKKLTIIRDFAELLAVKPDAVIFCRVCKGRWIRVVGDGRDRRSFLLLLVSSCSALWEPW